MGTSSTTEGFSWAPGAQTLAHRGLIVRVRFRIVVTDRVNSSITKVG